jgi:hypothetical protein
VGVEFLPRTVTGRPDTFDVYDPQADRANQTAYQTHTQSEIAGAQRSARADGRPTLQRGRFSEHRDQVLGVPGPRSQARCMRTVESPTGDVRYEFHCGGRVGRKPCGATPTVRREVLLRSIREVLSNGEHHLTLP